MCVCRCCRSVDYGHSLHHIEGNQWLPSSDLASYWDCVWGRGADCDCGRWRLPSTLLTVQIWNLWWSVSQLDRHPDQRYVKQTVVCFGFFFSTWSFSHSHTFSLPALDTHAKLWPLVKLEAGEYTVHVLVSDSGSPVMSSFAAVNITVCLCDFFGDCKSEAGAVYGSSVGISVIFLTLIMASVGLLLGKCQFLLENQDSKCCIIYLFCCSNLWSTQVISNFMKF